MKDSLNFIRDGSVTLQEALWIVLGQPTGLAASKRRSQDLRAQGDYRRTAWSR